MIETEATQTESIQVQEKACIHAAIHSQGEMEAEMAAASRQSYLQSNEGPGHTVPIYLQERTTKDRREKIINHANQKKSVIIHQHSVFFFFWVQDHHKYYLHYTMC